jgi:hypothetical protein
MIFLDNIRAKSSHYRVDLALLLIHAGDMAHGNARRKTAGHLDLLFAVWAYDSDPFRRLDLERRTARE